MKNFRKNAKVLNSFGSRILPIQKTYHNSSDVGNETIAPGKDWNHVTQQKLLRLIILMPTPEIIQHSFKQTLI